MCQVYVDRRKGTLFTGPNKARMSSLKENTDCIPTLLEIAVLVRQNLIDSDDQKFWMITDN